MTLLLSLQICHTQELRAALQVFTDHATVCDYQMRARLLAELTALCNNHAFSVSVSVAGEVSASSARLDVYSDHLTLQHGAVKRGEPSVYTACVYVRTTVG